MNYKNYSIIGGQYAISQDVVVDPRCNGWAAINQGDVDVTINGVLLKANPNFAVTGLAGEAFSVDGNQGEFYCGRLSIVFEEGGTSPRVQLIQKFYIQ